MRRLPAGALSCIALLCAAGCGSSSSSTGTSAPASGSTVTSPSGSTVTSPSGGLKLRTRPRFAAPPASAPVHGGSVQIAYRNITIQPDTVKVRVGSTITWTNYDSIEHNVTSEGGPQKFASGDISEGAHFAIKATKPGVIHYECTIHPTSMNGTIEVVR
jgi:plastocyanin